MDASANRNKSVSLSTIFLTIFIDMLGVGIVIPVIPALFFDAETTIFDPSFPESSRSILYGLLIASYPFMQFFGAPVLGALSDRYGRKPMLSASLVGTFIGYLLFGYAILSKNLVLLFISRMLPGFTGGNIAIILSAVSDVSTPETRVKNFGLVGTAFGLGFILGPAIGGILADAKLISWFNHATPFWFTAIITFVNLVLVQWVMGETHPESARNQHRRVSFFSGFKNLATSFQLPNLRVIFTVILFWSLGFTFYTQFFSVYLIQRFGITESAIGLLFGWIGIWLSLTQGLLVRRLSAKVSSTAIISVSLLALSLSLALILLPASIFWFYVVTPLIAIAFGMTSPNMTSLVSTQAGPERQGEILGINQSMQSIGQMIPPVLGGYFNTLDGRLPLATSAVLVFISWLFFVFLFRKRKTVTGRQ